MRRNASFAFPIGPEPPASSSERACRASGRSRSSGRAKTRCRSVGDVQTVRMPPFAVVGALSRAPGALPLSRLGEPFPFPTIGPPPRRPRSRCRHSGRPLSGQRAIHRIVEQVQTVVATPREYAAGCVRTASMPTLRRMRESTLPPVQAVGERRQVVDHPRARVGEEVLAADSVRSIRLLGQEIALHQAAPASSKRGRSPAGRCARQERALERQPRITSGRHRVLPYRTPLWTIHSPSNAIAETASAAADARRRSQGIASASGSRASNSSAWFPGPDEDEPRDPRSDEREASRRGHENRPDGEERPPGVRGSEDGVRRELVEEDPVADTRGARP